ncbi:MAG: HD domain-containing protein, partial [Clostridia bacterium]|nr:HD domain-containing protein [Clostridia bacterium]
MVEKAKRLVEELMKNDDSGHGIDHIDRVLDLAMSFAEKQDCNKELVALGALLHDVDDYKLFGNENQE